MSFTKLVEEILEETTVIGGANSCMGPNVTKTASAKSGDKYESGDARVPKSIYGLSLIHI